MVTFTCCITVAWDSLSSITVKVEDLGLEHAPFELLHAMLRLVGSLI